MRKKYIKRNSSVVVLLATLFIMVICVGCGKSLENSENETPKANVTSPPAGFNYTETEIPYEFEKGEYIAGFTLNEVEEPAIYTYKEGKKKTEYYVSVLQEDDTWKREKAKWSDSLNRLSSKVGNMIYKVTCGGDGNLYLWMSKREPDSNGEEFNVSYHIVSVSANSYVKEVKIKDLGEDRASCKFSYLNEFQISESGIGIFAGGNWTSYDMKTGKKRNVFDGIKVHTDDSGTLIYDRSLVMGNKLYTLADERCDKINVYDIKSGTLGKTIPCNSITTKGDTIFIPDEEANTFYTVNVMGIHRVDAETGEDELVISNNNQLGNENYKMKGAFQDSDNEKQFYMWYENQDSTSDEKGCSYFYKYVLNE